MAAVVAALSPHRGLWISSAPASGVQVIDRLIRASPCLWAHILDAVAVNPDPQACREIATTATCALASPCSVELVEDRMSLMKAWRVQLAKLLAAPGIEQRTPAWYSARSELTTASDVASAIGGRNGSSKEFLVKKAGGPEEQKAFSGCAPPLKWGIMFEPVANAIYAKRMGVCVHEFGLLRHPHISHIGASPDGISDMGVMVEIKCPFSRIIDGTVPSAYMAQIQCQLDVCGLDECDFFECQFDETGASGAISDSVERSWDGCERGIIVEHWDDESKAHVYHYGPDMGGDTEDEVASREEWARATVESLGSETPGVSFIIRRWKLRCLDIVRVHRDAPYIESMNASLAVVWRRVLRYREDRNAYKSEVLGLGPRRPATSASASASSPFVVSEPSLKGYAFVDDD